jgi:hypothetical protein
MSRRLAIVPALALALSASGGAADIAPMLAGLGAPLLDQRTAAIAAIGRLDGKDLGAALPELITRLEKGGWLEQSSAAAALGALGSKAATAVPALAQMASAGIAGGDWSAAEVACDALAAIDMTALAPHVQTVQKLLEGDAESPRYNALLLTRHLGEAGAPLAQKLVALSSDHILGKYAMLGLAAIGKASDLAEPTMHAALTGKDPIVALAALQAYIALGPRHPATMPALIAALDDESLRAPALAALVAIGHDGAAQSLPGIARAARALKPDQRPPFAEALKRLKTINQPPHVEDASAICVESQSVVIALPVTDDDDIPDVLSVTVTEPPKHGKLEPNGPTGVIYRADGGYTGPDAFAYTASDGAAASGVAHQAVTVAPDHTPPGIASTFAMPPSLTTVVVTFNEPVEPASAEQAGNYQLDRGGAVTAAKLAADKVTVSLTVTGLSGDATAYHLTVNGVRDRASTPNTAMGVTAALGSFMHGLAGEYFPQREFAGAPKRRIDATLDFAQGPTPGASNYSVRWSGWIEASVDGNYTFFTVSDDGSRLLIDDALVVNNWGDHGPTEAIGHKALKAGEKHKLTVEFYQGGGGQAMSMSWQCAGVPKQIIPTTALWTLP